MKQVDCYEYTRFSFIHKTKDQTLKGAITHDIYTNIFVNAEFSRIRCMTLIISDLSQHKDINYVPPAMKTTALNA